jgi:hypothetical protein
MEEDEQCDRASHEADLRYEPENEAEDARAHLARPGENLHEDIARQLPG